MATKGYLDVAGQGRHARRRWLALLAAAMALAAVTGWVYGRLERYQPDGRRWLPEDLLAGAEIEGDPAGIVREGRTLRLSNGDPAGGIGLRWLLERAPGDASVLELSAIVWTEGLSGGRPRWRGGRVTVTDARSVHPGDEPPRGRNIELANLQRDRAPAAYRKRFTFASDTPAVELAIRIRHATGTIGVSDLAVRGYVERPQFRAVANVVRAAWALLFLCGLGLALRSIRQAGARLALGALAVAGAALILMPYSLRETITGTVSRHLLRGAIDAEGVAQAGHVALFALLGCATRLLRPRDRLLVQLLAFALLAGASELAQLMADARQPSLGDWAADALGAVLGIGLAALMTRGQGRPAS